MGAANIKMGMAPRRCCNLEPVLDSAAVDISGTGADGPVAIRRAPKNRPEAKRGTLLWVTSDSGPWPKKIPTTWP